MFLKLVALLLCIAYVSCDETVQSVDCVNVTSHSHGVSMEVSGCNAEDERCRLFRGMAYSVKFVFEPTKDFKQKTDFKVFGVFSKFTVPYGKRTNACTASLTTDDETSCESLGGFLASREYRHTSTFRVSSTYPTLKLIARFVIIDRRSKEYLMCQELPIEIVDPPVTPSDEA